MMHKLITFIFLLTMSGSVMAGTDLSIDLKNKVNVFKTKIVLSNIADVSGRDKNLVSSLNKLYLKPTPRAGYEQVISREFIRRLISKQKYAKQLRLNFTGAEQTTVSLQSKIIRASDYLQFAESRLYEFLARKHTNIELESVGKYKSLYVPVGEMNLDAILNTSQPISRRMKVMVSVYSNNNAYAKIPVWFSVKAKAFAYKTNQHVAKNTIVTNSILERELVDIQDMKRNVVTDVDMIVNHKSNRDIKHGQVIRKEYLHEKLDVVAGQNVDVFYQSGGISLFLKAQAIEGGNKGKRIKLRNNSSKEIFEGIVLDKNKVKSI